MQCQWQTSMKRWNQRANRNLYRDNHSQPQGALYFFQDVTRLVICSLKQAAIELLAQWCPPMRGPPVVFVQTDRCVSPSVFVVLRSHLRILLLTSVPRTRDKPKNVCEGGYEPNDVYEVKIVSIYPLYTGGQRPGSMCGPKGYCFQSFWS